MKKHLLILMTVIIVMAIAFVACEKETNNNTGGGVSGGQIIESTVIEAQNVINGGANIATVSAIIYGWYGDADIITTGQYKNNGFKLTLPKILHDKYLYNAVDLWVGGIEVSDPKAKLGMLYRFLAYDTDESEIGEFYLWGESDRYYVAPLYVYADRDFTVKGKEGWWYPMEWDCSFKKGWNILYLIEEYGVGELYTTQKPSSITLNWEYSEYLNWSVQVRFSKEYGTDCYALWLRNDYHGYTVEEWFYDDAYTSYYRWITSGSYDVMRYDFNWNSCTDIAGYYFAKDRAYTVEHSHYGTYVIDDGPITKSSKCKNLLNECESKTYKGKNIAKMQQFLSEKSKANVK